MPWRFPCVRWGITAIVSLQFFGMRAAAAPAPWSLVLSGQDVTSLAELRESAGVLVLNVSALAPMLNLRIALAGISVTLTSASGRQWRATAGQFVLAGNTGRVLLPAPLRVEGAAVFLPVEALSQIADVEVSIDRRTHIARLNLPGHASSGASANERGTPAELPPAVQAPEGWTAFSTEKTDAEKQETSRLEGRPDSAEAIAARARATGVLREPDYDETLHITTEPSYVYSGGGGDGAMPMLGFGKLAGFDTDFNALPTFGPLGVHFLSGRVNFGDRGAGWNLSGGDLFSEIWGLARGFRYSDQTSSGNLVSTSLYLQTQPNGPDRPVVGVADQYKLAGHVTLAGELDSNSSYFGRATIQSSLFTGSVFYRDTNLLNGKSEGFFAGYQLLRRVGVSADYTSMGMGLDRIITRDAGIHWSVFRQVGLTVTETRTSTGYYKLRSDSAFLIVPMKRVFLNLRYQYRDVEYSASAAQDIAAFRTQYNQGTADVSMRVNARASLDEQIVMQWAAATPTTIYDQFTATVIASKKLNFNLLASLVDPLNPARLRVRAQYQFRPTAYVILEYGNIAPYQNVPPAVNPQTPDIPVAPVRERGLRIAIRKEWGVSTPTRGGDIQGRVLDANQQPVSGAVVEAGPYATETDEDGAFALRKLPRGEYTVKLREQTVPADLYGTADSVRFESAPGQVADIFFAMVNLREVHGWVFVDADGKGRPDEGTGVEMVTLKLGDEVTSSMIDGRFGFYNLKPGVYTVKIMSGSLPNDLVVASSKEVTVEVLPSGEVPEVLFHLEKKPEDIRFVEPLQDRITPAGPAATGRTNP
jgi:hypothetical protein